MKRWRTSLVVLAGLLLWSGCSSFDRDFKAAQAAIHPGPTIDGAWEGRWQSDNGHGSGKLRCILAAQGDGSYKARFRATYWGILKASYTVRLTGAGRDGEVVLLAGEEDLGFLAGGIYRYEGRVTPTDFSCNYSSKYDHGTFTLARPAGASGSAAHARR